MSSQQPRVGSVVRRRQLASRGAARMRIICFPYAGAGIAIFRSWPENLPDWVEVWSFELAGRDTLIGHPTFCRLCDLIHAVITEIDPLLDLPFVLFGHSMGALISFELARALRRFSLPEPTGLIVSGKSAPQLGNVRPPIHELPDSRFISELKKLEGMPQGLLLDEDLRDLFLPILRSDFALCERYDYESEPPLTCPIIAFGGEQDDYVGRKELSGWREQTSGAFDSQMFSGGHFFLDTCARPFFEAMKKHLVRLACK